MGLQLGMLVEQGGSYDPVKILANESFPMRYSSRGANRSSGFGAKFPRAGHDDVGTIKPILIR